MTSAPTAATPTTPKWFRLPVPEVTAQLGTDVDAGLSSAEAARRLQSHGTAPVRTASSYLPGWSP